MPYFSVVAKVVSEVEVDASHTCGSDKGIYSITACMCHNFHKMQIYQCTHSNCCGRNAVAIKITLLKRCQKNEYNIQRQTCILLKHVSIFEFVCRVRKISKHHLSQRVS